MSTGMTAVKSLSFAQHKSEQNKIAIAKAGYHRGDGILPLFCGIKFALCELGRPLYGSLGAIAAYVRTESLYIPGEV